VRIVNRGITCFIDPLGHVVQSVKEKKRLRDGTTVPNQEVQVAGSTLGEVPTSQLQSLYVRFGDFFAWACWVASFGLIGFSFTRRPTGERASS
jgi:apolipoprotein N-acyltransferase